MAGTKAGGLKAAATNKERNGKDFYKKIGAKGGRNGGGGGFAAGIGTDGLTGRERARIVGRIGGMKSRKPKKGVSNV